ncbi:MAG: hypothetical protein RR945_00590 [Erysipelotrichaceae bacterium]
MGQVIDEYCMQLDKLSELSKDIDDGDSKNKELIFSRGAFIFASSIYEQFINDMVYTYLYKYLEHESELNAKMIDEYICDLVFKSSGDREIVVDNLAKNKNIPISKINSIMRYQHAGEANGKKANNNLFNQIFGDPTILDRILIEYIQEQYEITSIRINAREFLYKFSTELRHKSAHEMFSKFEHTYSVPVVCKAFKKIILAIGSEFEKMYKIDLEKRKNTENVFDS